MRKYIFVAVLVLMASGTQAATLNVDGGTGQLLGASGVDVGGTLYNVEFLDGTCIDLYNGFAAAGLASQALLDQVFSDSPSGNFDAVPGLTTGCDGLVECIALTPFERPSLVILDVLVSEMLNSVQETGDFLLSLESWNVGQDTTFDESVVFVVWSPSPSPNPPPRLLLSLGLTGLSWKGHKSIPAESRSLTWCRQTNDYGKFEQRI
ncbi:MAG: hypothetical protein ABGX04_13415 [Myxococcales bacterium]|nr:hypothetical protein [Myxococcales bacterium]